jgi:site-specific recombinase XerD
MATPEWAPWIFEAVDRNEVYRLLGPIPAVLVGTRETMLDQLVHEQPRVIRN